MKVWDLSELSVRVAGGDDTRALTEFRCALDEPWEEEVERQVRGPLPRRYVGGDPLGVDPRLLLCTCDSTMLAVAAHRVEPLPIEHAGVTDVLRPTYVEAIAVALEARRTRVGLDRSETISFGEFIFDAVVTDVLARPDRAPFMFCKVHRSHAVSLAFCDRVGLTNEKPNSDPRYVQRWGDL